jgi:hypothetical protein
MKNNYLKYLVFALATIFTFILIELSIIEFAKNMRVETHDDKIILTVGVITSVAINKVIKFGLGSRTFE